MRTYNNTREKNANYKSHNNLTRLYIHIDLHKYSTWSISRISAPGKPSYR